VTLRWVKKYVQVNIGRLLHCKRWLRYIPLRRRGRTEMVAVIVCYTPYSDFAHFSGMKKVAEQVCKLS
jgi:hypothetical protein